MDHNSLFTLISLIVIAVGILGTFLPVLPGLFLCYGGLLLYKFGTGADLSMVYIWIFGILTLVSAILNYVIPARTNKKYGGTRWGSIGSVVGTLIGLFFFPPFGFFIGMLLGVFLGEIIHDANDRKKAWNSVKGAFIGFIYGTGFSFMIGLAMFLVVVINIFAK